MFDAPMDRSVATSVLPPTARARMRLTRAACALGLLALGTCASHPSVQRDLSKMPPGQVGFDDLCGLQSYFDAIAIKTATAPAEVDGADIERASESGTSRGGRTRFAFESDFQLTTVRRILNENWKLLPLELPNSHLVEIEVTWSERSGLKRVVTDSEPQLFVDGKPSLLPNHVCLSELLFGEPIYKQRRDMLGLPPLPTAHSLALAPDADAGSPDASVTQAAPSSSNAGTPAKASKD